jgi:RNA polymerase sigma-70 factor (ECF subfamily)
VNEPDPAVIRAAQDGDRDAYAELVRSHYEPVHRYLARLLGDHALAEDVAQETFVRCYRALHRYQFEGRFTTWLIRVAHNAGIDAIRARTRHARLTLEAPRAPQPSEPSTSVELDAALAALPPKLRDALLLVEVVGLRYREAALALSVPAGTVKSRVARAREQLLAWYGAHDEEAGDALR